MFNDHIEKIRGFLQNSKNCSATAEEIAQEFQFNVTELKKWLSKNVGSQIHGPHKNFHSFRELGVTKFGNHPVTEEFPF